MEFLHHAYKHYVMERQSFDSSIESVCRDLYDSDDDAIFRKELDEIADLSEKRSDDDHIACTKMLDIVKSIEDRIVIIQTPKKIKEEIEALQIKIEDGDIISSFDHKNSFHKVQYLKKILARSKN